MGKALLCPPYRRKTKRAALKRGAHEMIQAAPLEARGATLLRSLKLPLFSAKRIRIPKGNNQAEIEPVAARAVLGVNVEVVR